MKGEAVMFGHLERHLRQVGVKGNAVVLNVKMSSGMQNTYDVKWDLRLRVEPAGDPPFDVEVHDVHTHKSHTPTVGAHIAILYDAADHSKIMLDPSANQIADPLQWKAVDQAPAGGQNVVDMSGALGGGTGHMGSGSSDPVELLAKLAELHAGGLLTDEQFESQKVRLLGETP